MSNVFRHLYKSNVTYRRKDFILTKHETITAVTKYDIGSVLYGLTILTYYSVTNKMQLCEP